MVMVIGELIGFVGSRMAGGAKAKRAEEGWVDEL